MPIKNGIFIVKSTQNNVLHLIHQLSFEYITKRARNPKTYIKCTWKLVYHFLLEYGTQRCPKHIFWEGTPKRDIKINIISCNANTFWPTHRLKRFQKRAITPISENLIWHLQLSYIYMGICVYYLHKNSFFYIHMLSLEPH